MELIIGRKGDQSFPITEKTVSGKHVKLTTLPNGGVQIEDLGSSNGTFIDGVRVIKKVVSPDTVIQLGPQFTFKVSDALSASPKTPPIAEEPKEYSISHLKDVWDEYENTLAEIRKKSQSLGKKRMIPMTLGSISGVICAFVGQSRMITIPVAAISAIVLIISLMEKDTSLEDSKTAKDKLIKNYICPSCHRTLPLQDYSIINQYPSCPHCRCKWNTK